jgi:hypothetical protein
MILVTGPDKIEKEKIWTGLQDQQDRIKRQEQKSF